MVADGVLVAGSDVRVDESHLTGESEDVAKDTKDHPLMLSGSRVMHGSGRVLVLAVGCSSQQGQISELVQGNGALDAPKKRSHLGESLETLARQIGTAGVVAAAFCFVFLAGRVLIDASVAGTPLLQVGSWDTPGVALRSSDEVRCDRFINAVHAAVCASRADGGCHHRHHHPRRGHSGGVATR